MFLEGVAGVASLRSTLDSVFREKQGVMWPQHRGCALAMDSLSYSKHPAQVAQGNALLKASSQGVQEVKLVSILFHRNDKEHLLARMDDVLR